MPSKWVPRFLDPLFNASLFMTIMYGTIIIPHELDTTAAMTSFQDFQYNAIQIPHTVDDPASFLEKVSVYEQKRRISFMSNPEAEDDDDSDDSRRAKRAKASLLTEEEKRTNHIASEQKRRNTIRSGFKEMTDIIPTLKNVNHSKSTILFKAAEYIKHLDKRNEELRRKVAMLQRRSQRKPFSYGIHRHPSYSAIAIPASASASSSPLSSPTTSISTPSVHTTSCISPAALVVPNDDYYAAPSLNIPADEDFHKHQHHSHPLLTFSSYHHRQKFHRH